MVMGVGEFKTIRRSGYLTPHDLFLSFGIGDEMVQAAIDSGHLTPIDTLSPQARRDANSGDRRARSHDGIGPLTGLLFKGAQVERWLDAGLPTSKPQRQSPAARAKKVIGGTSALSTRMQHNKGGPPMNSSQAIKDWNVAVENTMETAGVDRLRAVGLVRKRDPRLHQEYMTACCTSKAQARMVQEKFG